METPGIERHSERRSVPRMVTPMQILAYQGEALLRFPLKQPELTRVVREALDEDQAFKDITTIATVVSERRARATLNARGDGCVCGVPLALEAFRLLDPKVSIRVECDDGRHVKKGDPVLFLTGHARGLLAAERVALNFLQRLSGIATLTAKFVDAIKGTKARILDTRKTTPGWRVLEKYAVRSGGGANHRMDLASAVLIKDNHIAACEGDVGLAVRRARELAQPGVPIEVECENQDQLRAALESKVDIVLLDNMSVEQLRTCVGIVDGRAKIEASGGVTLSTVRGIAETGVDWISVGALTHSPPALNLAVDFD
jgi:nicotinate-nucleotide pyrophosphorylase (carboxylating)